MSTTLTSSEQIVQRIGELQEALAKNLPNYESLLHIIHTALHKDEECVVLLTPEQVGVLCAGLSKKKGIVIAVNATKSAAKKTAGGKKLSDVTLDDLGG